MRVKGIIAEDFVNYKVPSMFIASINCDWKCCREYGSNVCQNTHLAKAKIIDIPNENILNMYIQNNISQAVVIGGLEPFLQFEELCKLIAYFREHGENCPFIIYTGYYPDEIKNKIEILSKYKNIIVKYGRYIPNSVPTYDATLGVTLSSSNQFAQML